MKYFLIVCSLAAYSLAAPMKRMYSEEKSSTLNAEDLESSGSGYIYTSASGQPTSYVQFTSNTGYAQPPKLLPVYYIQKPVLAPQAAVSALPVAPPEDIEKEELELQDEKEDIADNEGYEEENGGEYEKSQHSAHGEKGDKAYNNKHSFHKGVKGSHGNQEDEGYYKQEGGQKLNHHQSGGQFAQNHEESEGHKGSKFGEKSHHKKGQKTTGFHNVYHKDEYKKDHTFYDEADRSGFFKKYGKKSSHKQSEEGGHKKGGNTESEHENAQHGKKGFYENGRYNKEDAGFRGKHGHDAHHATYADYAQNGGKSNGKGYAYQEGNQ